MQSTSSKIGTNLGMHMARFFKAILAPATCDYLITGERKATAIVRLMMENCPGDTFPLSWRQIISSTALELLPEGFFAGKRVLVFDEMIQSGASIASVVTALEQRGVERNNILTSALATAAGCRANIDFCYFRHLDAPSYEQLRTALVRHLQANGSLLLDTEHIEVELKPLCPEREVLEALAQSGPSVVFPSSPFRTHVTVVQPDSIDLAGDDERLERRLGRVPEGSVWDNIVAKGRVVPRGGDSLALIAIRYPAIPSGELAPEEVGRIPGFLRPYLNSPIGRFYACGIVASMGVLASMVASLYQYLGRGKFHSPCQLDPETCDRDAISRSLEHLSVMLPNVDLHEFSDYLTTVLSLARDIGIRRSSHKHKYDLPYLSSEESTDTAYCLAQELELLRGETYPDSEDELAGREFTNEQLFEIGKRIGLSETQVSAGVDRLIDEAYLKTNVRTVGPYIERTFELDSEIVRSELARYTMLNGLVPV